MIKTDFLRPDKWVIVTDEPDCVSTNGERTLAELRNDEFIDCNTVDNARLVAAAPEMLVALEMFVQWEAVGSPSSDDCFAIARAAIAKAKGTI